MHEIRRQKNQGSAVGIRNIPPTSKISFESRDSIPAGHPEPQLLKKVCRQFLASGAYIQSRWPGLEDTPPSWATSCARPPPFSVPTRAAGSPPSDQTP